LNPAPERIRHEFLGDAADKLRGVAQQGDIKVDHPIDLAAVKQLGGSIDRHPFVAPISGPPDAVDIEVFQRQPDGIHDAAAATGLVLPMHFPWVRARTTPGRRQRPAFLPTGVRPAEDREDECRESPPRPKRLDVRSGSEDMLTARFDRRVTFNESVNARWNQTICALEYNKCPYGTDSKIAAVVGGPRRTTGFRILCHALCSCRTEEHSSGAENEQGVRSILIVDSDLGFRFFGWGGPYMTQVCLRVLVN
jgi:hypothetical protein